MTKHSGKRFIISVVLGLAIVFCVLFFSGVYTMNLHSLRPYGVTEPLQVQGGYFCVRALDETSDSPVANVYVELDWTFTGSGYDWGMYTDSNGEAKKAVPLGDYYVRLSHAEYEVYKSTRKTISIAGETWFTFQLTPFSGSGITLAIYLVDPHRSRVHIGKVTYIGEAHPVDIEGKVLLFHVPASTTISMDIEGEYMVDFWNWAQFDFTATVTTPSSDETYTVYVADEMIVAEDPPVIPPNPWNILYMIFDWLRNFWYVPIILIVVIYVSPVALQLLKIVKPPSRSD